MELKSPRVLGLAPSNSPAPIEAPSPTPTGPVALAGELGAAHRAFLEAQRENGTINAQVRQLEQARTGLIERQKGVLAARRSTETVVELRRIKDELHALDDDVEVLDNRLRPLHARATVAAQRSQACQQRLFQCQERATRVLEEMRGAQRWGTEGGQRTIRTDLVALIGEQETTRLVANLERPPWARP